MTDAITDIWFRTPLPLEEIALALGLTSLDGDSGLNWEWVTGTTAGVSVMVFHTAPRWATEYDTRVALEGGAPLTKDLLDRFTTLLRPFVPGPISFGRWAATDRSRQES